MENEFIEQAVASNNRKKELDAIVKELDNNFKEAARHSMELLNIVGRAVEFCALSYADTPELRDFKVAMSRHLITELREYYETLI